ncbi:phosphonopyruvate decarboxylase [Desulfurivibrio alkaliphilus]|uniref:Phosphonopyruvate decarboxylase n=1 Tax=Desulfurivibrio alkaliphilus (strain DSM 19089 / UNIQEM U267 / AHT2) TaxID=589865 RepID=D6Z4R5_DESAT|nr:phosphonopyruvate decarboxylase [Desulfurivibrio alkaliphilus]ADH86540.1 phosphonopyruvate decarboxylase [Desulfurivibrio alkaliphilus AHT 2]
MISPRAFHQALAATGVNFFTGVPDSLLKEFCAYIDAALPPAQHLPAANEGTAIGIAAGVHLATGEVPLIYMQNSGLGNAVNPLLSLADPEVYGMPLLLLVGWRGEPGLKDEPQHVKQGRVSPAMLEAMEIPYRVLGPEDAASAADLVSDLVAQAKDRSGPVAILVRKKTFAKSEAKRPATSPNADLLRREEAVEAVTAALPAAATVVATTGHISRELYEQRLRANQDRAGDFLTVGSMGHSSQIALGLALADGRNPVVCLDGDGAALMHLGGLATIGATGKANSPEHGRPLNYLHVVLNNGEHGSVGGQPTVAMEISLTDIARGCGYRAVHGPLSGEAEIRRAVADLLAQPGPRFLEIRVRSAPRADLGRPRETPAENKQIFIQRLRQS